MNVFHGNPGAIPEHTPDIRAVCPDCKRITAFLRAYREFGYATLTWEECRVSYEAVMTGAGRDFLLCEASVLACATGARWRVDVGG